MKSRSRSRAQRVTLIGGLFVLVVGCEADDAQFDLFVPRVDADAGSAGTAGTGAQAAPCRTADDCPDSDLRYCDPVSLSCVGCLGDSDCSQGEVSRCHPTHKICVDCLDSQDCAGTSDPICVDGTCAECASDADCAGSDKPGCLIAEHRCEDCSQDAHCPTGQICDVPSGSCR